MNYPPSRRILFVYGRDLGLTTGVATLKFISISPRTTTPTTTLSHGLRRSCMPKTVTYGTGQWLVSHSVVWCGWHA